MKKGFGEHGTLSEGVVACLGALALLVVSGCAGSSNTQTGPINPNLPVGLPPAPPAASSNSFTGTQSPGLWNVVIDDIQQRLSYQALTYPASPNTPSSDTFLPSIGFESLFDQNGAAGGYEVEVPGRAVLLQPGDNTVAPVFAVEQDSCFAINGNVKFHFVYVPNELDTVTPAPVYGSIEAQTSTDGKTWHFGGQAQYALPFTMGSPSMGLPVQPGTPVGGGVFLPIFDATCAVTNGNAAITAASNVSSLLPVSPLPTTFVVGPTGFFLEDQGTGKQTNVLSADATSFIGVITPSSPLTTASIVAAKYVGFLREAASPQAGAVVSKTEPIGFGQVVAGSGTSMTGGTFVNDDITQFQNSNIVINLGSQDPANNGLYSLATITVLDPKNVCVYDPANGQLGARGVAGVDQYGNEICTFNAVAVVGNPENKYAIFIGATDVVSGLPMGIYLFQQ